MPHFLGFDCGGTTIRALVTDENESVIFEGRGGPGNIASTPLAAVRQNLAQAVSGMPGVDAAVGCFAGLLGDDRRAAALEALNSLGLSVPADVFPDYAAALAAAGDEVDVVVIAGTGSLVTSFLNGELFKSGGGGPLLGDEGSAFDIGRRAIALLCIDDIQAEGSPEFWETVQRLFGTTDRQALVAAVYAPGSPAERLAQLAPVVGEDARNGLPYASGAVDASLTAMVERTRNHCSIARPNAPKINIALSGGLWDASPHFQKRYAELLKFWNDQDQSDANSRQYSLERLASPPVLGAARLARRLFYGH